MQNLKFWGTGVAAAIVMLAVAPAPASARNMNRHGGEAMAERMCAAPREMKDDFADRLATRLKLSDAQKAALKDLRDVHQKAGVDANTAACATKPDLSTFSGRLAFHEKVLEAHLATVKATRPKLDAFYNSLDDAQKKGFTKVGTRLGQ